MKLEGNEIISTDDRDIFYAYYDCWKSTTDICKTAFQGIVEVGSQAENAIKHRINAGDKATDTRDETVASIFDNKLINIAWNYLSYLLQIQNIFSCNKYSDGFRNSRSIKQEKTVLMK